MTHMPQQATEITTNLLNSLYDVYVQVLLHKIGPCHLISFGILVQKILVYTTNGNAHLFQFA